MSGLQSLICQNWRAFSQQQCPIQIKEAQVESPIAGHQAQNLKKFSWYSGPCFVVFPFIFYLLVFPDFKSKGQSGLLAKALFSFVSLFCFRKNLDGLLVYNLKKEFVLLQIELRRAYNCEIMLSKVKVSLTDLMVSLF